MKKYISNTHNPTNTDDLNSVLGKRRLDASYEQTNKRFKENDHNEGSETTTNEWSGFHTTDHTSSADPSNQESNRNSSSDKSESSDNESNFISVGNNTASTINIKQKSKQNNYIIIHTNPDTTIKLNIQQNSDKNNYLIIDPKDPKDKNIPENKDKINIDKPITSQQDCYYENNTQHDCHYENSTHNDRVVINTAQNVNFGGTQYNNTQNIEDKLNEALTILRFIDKTKKDSKIESKDDISKSGGSGLSSSGPI